MDIPMHTEINLQTGEIIERPLTDEEIAAAKILEDLDMENFWNMFREKRNKKLQESDWIVSYSNERGVDVPENWKIYRQALRDLPENTEDPKTPDWPTKPS